MLHDSIMSGAGLNSDRDRQIEDRRRELRVPFPAELVLIWHHDPKTPMRYAVVNAGDGEHGGFRIRSSLPLLQGMTGMALRLLPDGTPIERPVMVVWVSECSESGIYDIGLRYF